MLGATAVLITLVPASTAAVPARDQTTSAAAQSVDSARAAEAYYTSYGHPEPIASAASDSTSRPSWLGFALAAGGAC
jgi:hypothetical protein